MKPLPIAAGRLLLREFRPEDEAAVHAFTSDPEVTLHTGWEPKTPEETGEMLRGWVADNETWPRKSIPLAIELCAAGKTIGWTGFTVVDPVRQTGTFGYVLHRDYWGQGFATEAARSLVRWGFAELGLHRVVAECSVENPASSRILEKLGMRREGHFRENVFKAGKWRDTFLYAMLREEWD